jgi:hypothetical protein
MVSTSRLNLNPDFDYSDDLGRHPTPLCRYPLIDRQLKAPNYCLGSIVKANFYLMSHLDCFFLVVSANGFLASIEHLSVVKLDFLA